MEFTTNKLLVYFAAKDQLAWSSRTTQIINCFCWCKLTIRVTVSNHNQINKKISSKSPCHRHQTGGQPPPRPQPRRDRRRLPHRSARASRIWPCGHRIRGGPRLQRHLQDRGFFLSKKKRERNDGTERRGVERHDFSIRANGPQLGWKLANGRMVRPV